MGWPSGNIILIRHRSADCLGLRLPRWPLNWQNMIVGMKWKVSEEMSAERKKWKVERAASSRLDQAKTRNQSSEGIMLGKSLAVFLRHEKTSRPSCSSALVLRPIPPGPGCPDWPKDKKAPVVPCSASRRVLYLVSTWPNLYFLPRARKLIRRKWYWDLGAIGELNGSWISVHLLGLGWKKIGACEQFLV